MSDRGASHASSVSGISPVASDAGNESIRSLLQALPSNADFMDDTQSSQGTSEPSASNADDVMVQQAREHFLLLIKYCRSLPQTKKFGVQIRQLVHFVLANQGLEDDNSWAGAPVESRPMSTEEFFAIVQDLENTVHVMDMAGLLQAAREFTTQVQSLQQCFQGRHSVSSSSTAHLPTTRRHRRGNQHIATIPEGSEEETAEEDEVLQE